MAAFFFCLIPFPTFTLFPPHFSSVSEWGRLVSLLSIESESRAMSFVLSCLGSHSLRVNEKMNAHLAMRLFAYIYTILIVSGYFSFPASTLPTHSRIINLKQLNGLTVYRSLRPHSLLTTLRRRSTKIVSKTQLVKLKIRKIVVKFKVIEKSSIYASMYLDELCFLSVEIHFLFFLLLKPLLALKVRKFSRCS